VERRQDRHHRLIDGDHDVFATGASASSGRPATTPGHAVLAVRLKKSGVVILSGDLYHLEANRKFKRMPSFNTERADTLASMDSGGKNREEHESALHRPARRQGRRGAAEASSVSRVSLRPHEAHASVRPESPRPPRRVRAAKEADERSQRRSARPGAAPRSERRRRDGEAEHRRTSAGAKAPPPAPTRTEISRDQRRAERDGSAADGEQQDQQCTGHRHHAGEERRHATASTPMASDQIRSAQLTHRRTQRKASAERAGPNADRSAHRAALEHPPQPTHSEARLRA